MFRKNDEHFQEQLFTHYETMKPGIARLLEKTWAPIFYEQVFCKIREEIFAPLYSIDNGRPNFPVNILASLEIIKHIFNYTDKELIEQFYFNYQVLYALGIRNLGEVYFAERTMYEFRERIVNYLKEHPDEDGILFDQFEILTRNFIEVTGIKTEEQRTDSTLVSSYIKKAGRLSLAFDVLAQAVRALPPELLSDGLKDVLKSSFKTNLLYNTRNQALDGRLSQVIALMGEVVELTAGRRDLLSLEAIKILLRFLNEQTVRDETGYVPKSKKEIDSGSLQSAFDPDATFRDKAGKKHSGYVLNLVETCAPGNVVQLITDYKLEPNNKSDVEIVRERIPVVKERTDLKDLYSDGGYYGEPVVETAAENGVTMHYTDMTGKKTSADKLSLSEFEWSKGLEVVSCPEDRKPLDSVYDAKKKLSVSHFAKEDCQACILRDNCPVLEQKKSMLLKVHKNSIVAARVREDLSHKEVRRENTSRRAAIEGANSSLKRSQGMDKLRVRGIVKCSMQSAFKVIGHNFKQVYHGLKKLLAKPPAQGSVCPNAC
jgi:hypothetical protein